MNYYDHHIRDYDAATAHLTWDEDMAYTRLLRWYYRKEQPPPGDIKEVCRQVRATSKAQRDAVATVLKEFFELREDGCWHQETCDEVIRAFQAGEPEREVKKANEDNRLRKHREERARLFKILTDAGGHAPWNIKIDELRALVEGINPGKPATREAPGNGEPETEAATAPATPATATQYPIPNTHSPIDIKEERDSAGAGMRSDSPDANGTEFSGPSPTHCGAMAKLLRTNGVVDVAPGNPTLRSWVDAGLTADEALAGLAIARNARGAPSPMSWAYLARVLETQRQRASAVVPTKPSNPMPTGKFDPSAHVNRNRSSHEQGGDIVDV